MRFAIYNDQTKRLTRVIIMLFLKFSFRLDMITQIDILQLLIYKCQLTRKQFCNCLKFEHKNYFQIPVELTMEFLPLSFQFYNCIIPILEKINIDCYNTYLNDCDKYMQMQSYRKAVKQGKEFQEIKSEDLVKLVVKEPELMCPEAQYGIKNTFQSSKTFRFIQKPYGLPRAHTLEPNSLPNKDFKILLDRELLASRKQELNDKLIVLQKFNNLKYKYGLVTSDI